MIKLRPGGEGAKGACMTPSSNVDRPYHFDFPIGAGCKNLIEIGYLIGYLIEYLSYFLMGVS